MFTAELLTRIVDSVIAQITERSGGRLVPRRQDSQGRLGRDLLAFYEKLDMYLYNAEMLAFHVKPSLLNPDYQRFGYHLDVVNTWSARVAKTVGELMQIVGPALEDHYDSTLHGHTRRRASARAARRASVLSIYDEQLVSLLYTAYEQETSLLAVSQALNALYFDSAEAEAHLFDLRDAKLPLITHLDAEAAMDAACEGRAWSPTHQGVRRFSLRDDEQVEQLQAALNTNVETVRALRERVKLALREHFTIDDLL